MDLVNLTTDCGGLGGAPAPSGTGGCAGLAPNAVEYDLRGLVVAVAASADVIRSKEAADRTRDRQALAALCAPLAQIRKQEI